MNKININQNVDITILNTNKFKDILISVRFLNNFTKESALNRLVLSLMLQDRTNKYNTKDKFVKQLDLMYGAIGSVKASNNGLAHALSFNTKVINDKFTTTKLLESQFELLNEMIFNPLKDQELLSKETFSEAIINLKSMISRRNDRPSSFAFDKVLNLLGKDYALSDSALPSFDEVEKITLQGVTNEYNNALQTNKVDIIIIGDVDNDLIKQYTKKHLSFESREINIESEYAIKPFDLVEESITKKIDQSVLALAFTTNISIGSNDYFKLRVANAIFGQLPTSLLFQQVREKNSLCYSIYSNILPYEASMVVTTGIEKANVEKAKELILIQFESMKSGNFSDEDFETSKLMLIDSINQSNDDVISLLNFNYQNIILDSNRDFDSCINTILATTKDDVIEIFKQINHVVTFTLLQEDKIGRAHV